MASARVRGGAARVYAGKVKAVIFDWAGTIVDHGSCAPVLAFIEVFKRNGVTIDVPTARGPMGTNKRDHISAILAVPEVAAAWATAHAGVRPGEASIDALYAQFTPIQVEVAATRTAPIRGAVEVVAALRARGVRCGGDSGYNAEILGAVTAGAAAAGLVLDANACANVAGTNGRPKPFLALEVAGALDAWPLSACVKVDDTLPGIGEGVSAGMWTVGVSRSGNELGLLREEDAAELPPGELTARLAAAQARFAGAGAHYVIDSVADLLPVIEDIEARLAAGETPLGSE